MNIAITVDPEISVPPLYYGGIERIVSMLIDEFILAGHQVTLFAHESSVTPALLQPYPGKSSKSKIDTIRNMHLLSTEIYKGNFDVLQSFSRLAYLTFILPFRIPKVMSYQRKPTVAQIKKAQKLANSGSLTFTGCSDYISSQIRPYGNVSTIYNGFPQDKYIYKETVASNAPLVFLGRIEPIKGPHHAIEIAVKSGKKLIIAGNIPSEYQNWFDNTIASVIDDDQIRYIGPVNDEEKTELLSNALAFLMPIEWDEPFGIVMAEAMACGTPVIALERGAVPEIITHGITGFICRNMRECIEKVSLVHTLSRKSVRDSAMARFSAKVIAKNYLELYQQIIKQRNS
ncbi:glycosyltransferase family 4 protein [Daejeonella oryzae]|uniref:glycosyltransferase family 4 protein n=1 Tax=Daejeonella oryzae TaxID=1122943 RepID=UPI00040344D3|nr:glycosyltransferase family 4 protein [Daejeonella oryzae]